MNDQERLLTIYLRLQRGERLTKQELADDFRVSLKTIQRDFSLLRTCLTQQLFVKELVYDAKTHQRYLSDHARFDKADILVISKIILENRAFNQSELNDLLDRLLSLLTKEEQKEITAIIASERLNYAPLADQQDRISKIWEWSELVRREQVIQLNYRSPYSDREKEHTVLPTAIYYDNHYFYVVAYHLKHQTYTTFKLDRILAWESSSESKPNISYGRKFRDGDVRNQQVDAFKGRLISVKLAFYGDETIVLDQFPDARLLSKENGRATLAFTSQNTPGLIRWLLSQGSALKILEPSSLVQELKNEIEKMRNNY